MATSGELTGSCSWGDESANKASGDLTMSIVDGDTTTSEGSKSFQNIDLTGSTSASPKTVIAQQTGDSYNEQTVTWSVKAYFTTTAGAAGGGGDTGEKKITLVPTLTIGGVVQNVATRVSGVSR